MIDNGTGAGGSIGSDAVAKAQPDDYTLLMATASTHAIKPALYARWPVYLLREFTPVSLLVRVPVVDDELRFKLSSNSRATSTALRRCVPSTK